MNISSFLNYLQYEKRFSRHTLVAYKSDLEQLDKYLLSVYEISDEKQVSHSLLRSWMVELVSDKLQTKSIRRKISAVKSYFRFLLRKGEIEKNPASALSSPKLPRRLPKTLDPNCISSLIDHHFFKDDFEGYRDRLIIELLFDCGIRLSELIDLSEQDISFSQMQLRILGKGKKERILPLSKSLKELIIKYLTYRHEIYETDAAFSLLLTDKGQKLYPNFVHRLLKKYLDTVTTAEHKNPHVMRHTFATTLLNNGADLNAIKTLLGHSSLAATQVYTHNSIEKIKKVYLQSHPKA